MGVSKFREDQLNTNLDFQLTSKNRLSAKFFGANNPATQALFNLFGLANALPVPGFGGTANLNQRVLSLDDTHVVSSHIVNDAAFRIRFHYHRFETAGAIHGGAVGNLLAAQQPVLRACRKSR